MHILKNEIIQIISFVDLRTTDERPLFEYSLTRNLQPFACIMELVCFQILMCYDSPEIDRKLYYSLTNYIYIYIKVIIFKVRQYFQ